MNFFYSYLIDSYLHLFYGSYKALIEQNYHFVTAKTFPYIYCNLTD